MKNKLLKTTAVLLILTITGCSCSFRIGFNGDDNDSENGTQAPKTFDQEAESLADANLKWHEARLELTMMIQEGEKGIDNILAKYDEVQELTDEITASLQNMIEIEETTRENQINLANSTNTAHALQDTAYSPQLPSLGRTETLLDAVNVFDDPFRKQNEAMRMGIYAGYQDMEKQYGDEATQILDQALEEAGVDDIEDIFYCEDQCIKDFWNERQTVEAALGDSIDWHTKEMQQHLKDESVEDVYAYVDNLTANMQEELDAQEYGEYIPKNIADFMIRNVGYGEYEQYLEHRRETQLKITNEVVETAEEVINEEPDDLFDEFKKAWEEDKYYGDDYEKNDNTETIIAYDPENGNLVVANIDTNDANGINLPEGNYNVLATTDGNLPMGAMDISVSEGQTTVVQNRTYDPKIESPGLYEFITNIGQIAVQLPTQAELNDLQNQIEVKNQMREQILHHLEILNSMMGGSFTTVSPEAKDKLGRQLSEIEDELEDLEEKLEEKVTIKEEHGVEEDNNTDSNSSSTNPYDEDVMLHAYGVWDNGSESGDIDLTFSSGGGPVTGTFGNCIGGECWASTATGTFDGEDYVSGTISGSGSYSSGEYTTSYTISGSFSGSIYLNRDFGEGTFSTTTYIDGYSYTDPGTWIVSF